MKIRIRHFVIAGAIAYGYIAHAADGFLIRGGKAEAVLVTGKLSASESTAVRELQRILKQMTGIQLPAKTVSGAAGHTGNQVWIGSDAVSQRFPKLDLKSLGDDGILAQTNGRHLILTGYGKRGTLYAVFSFLESVGCRFWTPQEELIPSRSSIKMPNLRIRKIPTLDYRDLLYADTKYWGKGREISDGGSWSVRNKRNGFGYDRCPESWGGRVKYHSNFVHSFARHMRPINGMDGSFERHPEYWALIGNRRRRSQPCVSHPMVHKIMLANVMKMLDENPDYQFAVIGQDDNRHPCECTNCKALYDKYQSRCGATLLLANKIAEQVEKRHPNVWVLAPAYEWTRKPPVGIRPRKNVATVLCSIETDFNTPWEKASTEHNKSFKEDIQNWGRIAQRLYVWDYTTNFKHFLLPHPNFDSLGPNMRFLAEHGLKGMFAQGSYKTNKGEMSDLRMWLLCKLMWSPKADTSKLIRDFVTGYYGPAAKHIQDYLDIIHAPGRKNPGMQMSTYSYLNAEWLSPNVIADAQHALQKAADAVKGDSTYEPRVRRVQVSIWYVLLKRPAHGPTWRAVRAKNRGVDPKAIAEAFLTVAKLEKMGQIAEGETIGPFLKWVSDYYVKRSHYKNSICPPELRSVSANKVHVIQACQMDARARFWMPMEGASDGWVCNVQIPSWTIKHYFSATEEILPGKRYKLYARVKSPTSNSTSGSVYTIGIWGDKTEGDRRPNRILRRVQGNEIKPGQFQAIEVGTLDETARDDTLFIHTHGSNQVWLDCFWLIEQ